MKIFLDTSSLVKLYHNEDGSEVLENYIQKNIDEIFLSELAILEFRSALWRKVRMKEIEEVTAKEVIFCFKDDENKFSWIKLKNSSLHAASELLMKYGNRGLRTLDSLQLASALTLKEQNCIFLTFDKLLESLFVSEKLEILTYEAMRELYEENLISNDR
jgi:predicted nucleic acid-binding protein